MRWRGLGSDDQRLVERVRAGDDAAFEAVYDRYARGLLAFCHHMLSSRDEAEDALQHTFAAAYRMLRSSENEVELRPWLYTVARNRCLSLLRARRVHVSLDAASAYGPVADGLTDEVQRRSDLRELLEDVHRLPPDQRVALVLLELGGLPQEEIATVLNVRRDKVKALVFQAREGLMRARQARALPCTEMREQLARLDGKVPRRGMLRRHVDRCPSCALFEAEVGRQRAGLALILPVLPTAGLKTAVLGSAIRRSAALAGGGAGAGGGAAVVGGAGGACGGGLTCAGAGGGAAGLAGASASVGASAGAAGGGAVATGAAAAAGSVGGSLASAGGAGTIAAAIGAKSAGGIVTLLAVVAVGGGAAGTGELGTSLAGAGQTPAAQHQGAPAAPSSTALSPPASPPMSTDPATDAAGTAAPASDHQPAPPPPTTTTTAPVLDGSAPVAPTPAPSASVLPPSGVSPTSTSTTPTPTPVATGTPATAQPPATTEAPATTHVAPATATTTTATATTGAANATGAPASTTQPASTTTVDPATATSALVIAAPTASAAEPADASAPPASSDPPATTATAGDPTPPADADPTPAAP
jgi:RNA polymerase sigma factor (sigma-70 family)